MNKRIYLSPPHLSGNEMTAVQRAFNDNWVAPVGPELNAWEEEIVQLTGSKKACLVNSGTAAIHLALRLLDVGPGDLVFVQAHTHIGCVNPILYTGATPVFIDSEPGTWNMSPAHLEEAIQAALAGGAMSPAGGGARRAGVDPKPSTPRAILPVHLYGMPANLGAIMEIAEKYGLPVIEDAAESLGSTYHGRHTGTFGKMGIYSFNGNKIITSSGGGALVSDDEDLIAKARYLATQARDDAPHYQHSEIGYNYRMSNVLAGIGRGQMQVLPQRVKQRRANFERYQSYFKKWNDQGFDIRFQEELEGSFSNRWLTAILIDPKENKGLTREDLRLALEAENIESRPLWKPMHLQPVFAGYPFFGDGTSENLFETGLCLPSGSNLTEADFARIFAVLDKIFDQA